MADVMVPVSPGELLDKITILELKQANITDADKQAHITRELALLNGVRTDNLPASEALDRLVEDLRVVNGALWRIEDDIRACEHAQDFSARFVELARQVYRTNDRRAALKNQINSLLNSRIAEQKSYAAYD